MIAGMVARGYERDFAERCFKQIEGFGNYGFPESHAASFALLVYASAWMKCRYPDVFACALLNAQPMGFYAPAQIVRDAREHGVEVARGRCQPLRLGLHAGAGRESWTRACIRATPQWLTIFRAFMRCGWGFARSTGGRGRYAPVAARRGAGYDSMRDFGCAPALPPAVLEQLAAADAFRSAWPRPPRGALGGARA